MAKKPDLMPGTLDMLILKTLTRAPQHGYGIALSIKRLSQDVLTVARRFALSLITALAPSRMGPSRMEKDSNQPPRTLLHPDRRRTQATRSETL
jgi:hypothetical protein